MAKPDAVRWIKSEFYSLAQPRTILCLPTAPSISPLLTTPDQDLESFHLRVSGKVDEASKAIIGETLRIRAPYLISILAGFVFYVIFLSFLPFLLGEDKVVKE